MRRAAVVSLSVLALVAGAAGVVAAPAAAVDLPTAPYTALGLAVNVGTTSTGGAREAVGDAVVADSLTTTEVSAHAATGSALALTITPPTGSTFAADTTFTVAATGDEENGTASVTAGDDHVCAAVESGSVAVVEATTDDAGALTAFAADVDLTCGDLHWVGYLRIASTAGYSGVTLDPAVTFPTVGLGASADLPVTLTATGTADLPAVTGATISGTDAAEFSVVGDTCTGTAVVAGASCTVTVRARPLQVTTPSTALLTLTHEGSAPYEVALSAATATDVAEGTYRTLTPQRAFDTRSGVGVRRGPVGTGAVLRVPLGRFLPVPASAVVLNLTVDRPTAPGYLTAYPTGTARPTTSSLNFPRGWQGANLVTVRLGTGNQIDIFNYLGNTPVIGDIVGYYASGNGARASGGGYHPVTVRRLLDTRTWGFGKLKAGYSASIPVTFAGDGGDIGALSVTVTAVRPTGTGYLTSWDGGATIPKTSTLNFGPATGVVSNAAIVPAGAYGGACTSCAVIGVLNASTAPTDVVVDVNGYFDKGHLPAAVRFHPLATPTRIVDTRSGLGATTFGPGSTQTVTTPPTVADVDTVALDTNVTAVAPTGATYVTVWPTGQVKPTTSVLNPNAAQTIADHAIVQIGADDDGFQLYNNTATTNLVVDVSGTFEQFPPTPADLPPGAGAAPRPVTPAAVVGTAPRPTPQAH